ncbi:MAG: glycoside hydrolase family 18 [Bacteroidales bacterium]|nr:glycoside hydrolase family 18 [Bacteroidales bacterium]
MKNAIYILIFAVCAVVAFSCTKTEALNYEPNGIEGSSHAQVYYDNLKEYKASDHSICFGWFSDWTGVGTQMTAQLMGMPDSIDVVSMWGNCFNLSEEKKEDLRKVQEIKGTKVMLCFIIDNVGIQVTPSEVSSDYTVNGKTYDSYEEAMAAYWGWYGNYGEDTSDEAMEKAIRKYADAILDSIAVYNYDGFDFDLEPNYGSPGNIASYPDRIGIFLDEMSKVCGPASGTGKLLCVDGQPYSINPEDGKLLDYFIIQAYGDGSYSSTDSRMNTLFNAYDGVLTQEEVMKKTILTSNFESYASTGGGSYTTRDGVSTNQLAGYAMYTYPGVDAKIGGIGAFRIGFDTNYQYIRAAISILNPPIK